MQSCGKLIVIEGLDGSGKGTQAELLYRSLSARGHEVREVSFPCYEEPSSALIKMYLNGEFGDSPSDVGAYAASTFYAVDRFASYKKDWGEFYKNGGIIICNRYVTSNLVHQMTKLPQNEWVPFMDWLRDLEYIKFGIPKPDLVIYLDMPIHVSQKLMLDRYNGDSQKKDIHEKDVRYLNACREAAVFAARSDCWVTIPCSDGDRPFTREDIHRKVRQLVEECILL